MKTRVIQPNAIDEAVSCLKQGKLVAFPTETVYGLGAPVFLPSAIEQIFAVKGRPADNPLIAHICRLEEAALLAEEIPEAFFLLARRFWPGPLTLIARRSSRVPPLLSAGHPTIAIRMPAHPVARLLIERVGEPLAAPSANLSGRPSPTSVQDVLEDLDGKIPLVIEGGPCSIGIESTVLNLASPRPVLLRPGAVSREELEEALGQAIDLPKAGGEILSPGMKYRHYAPKARMRLVYDRGDLRGPYTIRVTQQTLYAELRRADRAGASEIEIFCDASVRSDAGLMNRLLRASGEIV